MGDAGELLEAAVAAHGGLGRWQSVHELVARCRSGGFALASRLQPRAFARIIVGDDGVRDPLRREERGDVR